MLMGYKMSYSERQVSFVNAVNARDMFICRVCESQDFVKPHYILNKNLFPNGGAVRENGIALCCKCHEKARAWDQFSDNLYYSPAIFFEIIGSSLIEAIEADAKNLSNS
jgi:hypothetical protein